MTKKVLSVGSCSFDNHAIGRLVSANFDAELTAASLPDEALEMLRGGEYDLVLVNRKLEVDSSDGVDVVKRVKSDPQLADGPVMLLSSFPEAQEAAVKAGAEPGFGKAQLDRPETVKKLARFLGAESATASSTL